MMDIDFAGSMDEIAGTLFPDEVRSVPDCLCIPDCQ